MAVVPWLAAGILMPKRDVVEEASEVVRRSAATEARTFIAAVWSMAVLLEAIPTGSSAMTVTRENDAMATDMATSTSEKADRDGEEDREMGRQGDGESLRVSLSPSLLVF